jgi:hypothetical protein
MTAMLRRLLDLLGLTRREERTADHPPDVPPQDASPPEVAQDDGPRDGEEGPREDFDPTMTMYGVRTDDRSAPYHPDLLRGSRPLAKPRAEGRRRRNGDIRR